MNEEKLAISLNSMLSSSSQFTASITLEIRARREREGELGLKPTFAMNFLAARKAANNFWSVVKGRGTRQDTD